MIYPGKNGIFIATQLRHFELAAPTVIHQSKHRRFLPDGFTRLTVLQDAAQRIVAIGEGIRFNHDDFAHSALDGETSAIHFRADALDDDALATIHGSLDGNLDRGRRLNNGRRRRLDGSD